MKYKILLIMIILMPISVYADDIMNINCQKTKDEYTCEVVGNFEYEVSAIDFHYSLPTHAKLKNYQIDERWIGEADDFWVSLYSDENSQGKTPIITLIINSQKEITNDDITISDLSLYDENYQEHKIEIAVKENKIDKTLTIIVIICAIIVIGLIILTIVVKSIKKGDSQ